MRTDPARNGFRRKLSGSILLMLPLSLFAAQVASQVVHEGSVVVRFVCQAYSPVNQQYLDRVLILEQVSTQSLEPGGTAPPGAVDATVLVDADHETASTDEVEFRARIFDRVSLVSNLPDLLGHDIEQVTDSVGLGREEARRRYDAARQDSLSLGTTDDEVVAGLRRREAGFDVEGQRMDYMGIGARTGGRFGFRSKGPYRVPKSIDLFLKLSRGVVETGLGTSDSPEDGPYLCKEPNLVSAVTASYSGCMQSVEGSTHISAISNDRSIVRQIQRSLASRGFNPGPLDGIFGVRTYSALEAWKTSYRDASADTLTPEQLCSLLHPAA